MGRCLPCIDSKQEPAWCGRVNLHQPMLHYTDAKRMVATMKQELLARAGLNTSVVIDKESFMQCASERADRGNTFIVVWLPAEYKGRVQKFCYANELGFTFDTLFGSLMVVIYWGAKPTFLWMPSPTHKLTKAGTFVPNPVKESKKPVPAQPVPAPTPAAVLNYEAMVQAFEHGLNAGATWQNMVNPYPEFIENRCRKAWERGFSMSRVRLQKVRDIPRYNVTTMLDEDDVEVTVGLKDNTGKWVKYEDLC